MSSEFTINDDKNESRVPNSEPVRLEETTVEERREINKKQRDNFASTRKFAAKTVVTGIDNLDCGFGVLQQISLLLVAEFVRRGDWLNVLFFTGFTVLFYLIKIRMTPGPITRLAQSSADKIKGRLVDAGRTIIR